VWFFTKAIISSLKLSSLSRNKYLHQLNNTLIKQERSSYEFYATKQQQHFESDYSENSQQAQNLVSLGWSDLIIAINISPLQFGRKDL
jgi:hypothetical protein